MLDAATPASSRSNHQSEIPESDDLSVLRVLRAIGGMIDLLLVRMLVLHKHYRVAFRFGLRNKAGAVEDDLISSAHRD